MKKKWREKEWRKKLYEIKENECDYAYIFVE